MATFQAKIVLKMATKWENKNYRFVQFLPDALWKIWKKFKNKKNTIMASFQAKSVERGWEREKIKIIVSFRPYLMRYRKCKKKNAKKIKNTIMASFQAKIVLKMATKGENKNYRFVQFLPDALWKIWKKFKN